MQALISAAPTPAATSTVDLRVFFERSFRPHKLARCPQREHFYREAIDWLERSLARSPVLADVEADNLAAVAAAILAHGFTRLRARHVVKYLRGLRRHGERLGLVPCGSPRATMVPINGDPSSSRPAWLEEPPGHETLAAVFETVLRPKLAGCRSPNVINSYGAAVHQFNRHLGRYATVEDVAPERLADFRAALLNAGRAESLGHQYTLRIKHLARLARPPEAKRPPHNKFTADSRRLVPLPEPAADSLRALFENAYLPQRLLGKSATSCEATRWTLRLLYEFHGGDLRPDELTDTLAARFLAWLHARRVTAVTVNGHRGRLFAVWRFAVEQGLADREPRVKKLPQTFDQPDSWTEEETKRILAAPLAVKWRSAFIGGIPKALWWHAFLLVIYWTALRRGSVLKLRWTGVDLTSGWITLPGDSMKNRRGKRFRLGADAIAALRAIHDPARELVFPWPMDAKGMSQGMRLIVAAAGVAPATRSMSLLHKMRRTVATATAIRRGLHAACELLGHSSIEMTKRYIDASKLPGADCTEFLPMLSAPAGLAGCDEADRPAVADGADPLAGADDEGLTTTPLDPRTLLRDAGRLLDAGDTPFAAWGCRVALERWLQDVGQARGCAPVNGQLRGLLARARLLRDAGWLAAGDFAEIRAVNKAANRAVHGHNLASPKVAAMLASVGRIFEEYRSLTLSPFSNTVR